MSETMVTAEQVHQFIRNWHEFFHSRDPALLDSLVAENAVMKSPAFYGPKASKPYVIAIVDTAFDVFEDFHYVDEWIKYNSVILEFEARVGEHNIKGIDRFRLNVTGRIMELEVIIRPLNGLAAVAAAMRAKLEARSKQ